MARTKDKRNPNSPGDSTVATNRSRIQQKQTPTSKRSNQQQKDTQLSKRRLLYEEENSDDSKTEVSYSDSNHSNINDGSSINSTGPRKKHRSNDDKANKNARTLAVPQVIGHDDKNDDGVSSIIPFSVTQQPTKNVTEEDNLFPHSLKAAVVNTIRTQIFRRIKFLTNEKLSLESNIFKSLFNLTGYHEREEQLAKYEPLRGLVQRQMNSKRNYCTDQILAKARGTNADLLHYFYNSFYFIY